MTTNENLVVPRFFVNTMPNEAASKAKGRPVFQEMECIELRFAGNRQTVAVFPAHDVEPNATREKGEIVTYAQKYNDQYLKFKALEHQDVAGTPVSELPFLNEAKRRELRALNIHTAEALAALDGTPLKQLGMGGRELKNQAVAYLAAAEGTADVTGMAATIAALQQQIADRDELIDKYTTKQVKGEYQRKVEESVARGAVDPDSNYNSAGPFDLRDVEDPDDPDEQEGDEKPLVQFTNAELKTYIKEQTGEPVLGNPNRDTLLERATDIATRPDNA
jgi:hypothetical protein